ncbi:hypothetical protein EHS25_009077 [Saitozyma podzolica]|uniref:Uncharacterized protein n=1 Tax=Saitozyma podzolica TaxID=1890683 RepID=A0A427YKS2_9TREE|nr:hypothetical protein EHS25_009077 [Saitozyma podzolica]
MWQGPIKKREPGIELVRVYTRLARSSSSKKLFRFGLSSRKAQADAGDVPLRSSLDKNGEGGVVSGRETPDGVGETPRASSEGSIVQVDEGVTAGTRVVEREVSASMETIAETSEEMPSWDAKEGEETVVEIRFHTSAHRWGAEAMFGRLTIDGRPVRVRTVRWDGAALRRLIKVGKA